MDERVRLPRALGFDHDYWLCRCVGFRVEGPEGRLGVVEEVRFNSRPDRPDLLVVRAGLFGRRVVLVPVDAISEVVPRRLTIVLSAAPSSHSGVRA